ncbi:MAG TPA: hypothetical protein PLL02_00710 [Bacteroidales bacterium]|jgi:hypothetical protein|nr:hypothetical protein [Bacteroidales bacterium]
MKTRHLFFFIIIIFVFAGCTHRCPDDFPINVRYFPYKKGNILSFHNTQGDTVSSTVQKVMQNKNKNVPWGSKGLCFADYFFSSSGEVQLNGNFNAFAYSGNSHFSTISLSVDISYNKFTIFFDRYFSFEGNNYNIFGDTILLSDGQESITIVKNKGITEWANGKGEVWKLIN